MASASGKLADDAHQDRHHAGHQRGGGGDRREVRRAAAAEELAVGVGDGADDQRVEHDDVGHREERHQAAADLGSTVEPRSVIWKKRSKPPERDLVVELMSPLTQCSGDSQTAEACQTPMATSASATRRQSRRSPARRRRSLNEWLRTRDESAARATRRRPKLEPLDVDGVQTVAVGTIAWLVALVVLLPFYRTLEDRAALWWLWTCVRRHRDRVVRAVVLPPSASPAGRSAPGQQATR